jgi:hypothetical protein
VVTCDSEDLATTEKIEIEGNQTITKFAGFTRKLR